jgi:hypothetical protein
MVVAAVNAAVPYGSAHEANRTENATTMSVVMESIMALGRVLRGLAVSSAMSGISSTPSSIQMAEGNAVKNVTIPSEVAVGNQGPTAVD